MSRSGTAVRLGGALCAGAILCLARAHAQSVVGCFVNGRQVADSMCQPGAGGAAAPNPAASALVNSVGTLGTAVIRKLLEDKPAPGPGAAEQESEHAAALQRAMQVKSANEQRRREESEESSRAFRDGQEALATHVRSLGAEPPGDPLQVHEELRDALNDPPSASSGTAKAPPPPAGKQAAAPQRKPLPGSVDEIPGDWSCYPVEPQDNGAWEYLQCAGSREEHGRLHCFEKRGAALSPIACFR